MKEYIEREAAYEKCGWYNTVNGKSVCAVRKDELAAIPAADVAPVVHGRWIDWKPPFFGMEYSYDTMACSECGHTMANALLIPANYCPNCGADMRGE